MLLTYVLLGLLTLLSGLNAIAFCANQRRQALLAELEVVLDDRIKSIDRLQAVVDERRSIAEAAIEQNKELMARAAEEFTTYAEVADYVRVKTAERRRLNYVKAVN